MTDSNKMVELAAKCERLETDLSEANRRLEAYEVSGSPCEGCNLRKLYERCPECNRLNSEIIDRLKQYVDVLKADCEKARAMAAEAINLLREHQGMVKGLL